MVSSKHHDRAVNSIRADRISERPDDGGRIWPTQRGQLPCNATICRNGRAGAHPATIGKRLRPLRSGPWMTADSPTNTTAIPGPGISSPRTVLRRSNMKAARITRQREES